MIETCLKMMERVIYEVEIANAITNIEQFQSNCKICHKFHLYIYPFKIIDPISRVNANMSEYISLSCAEFTT